MITTKTTKKSKAAKTVVNLIQEATPPDSTENENFVLPESAKGVFLEVARERIEPSTTNPRTFFDEERVSELAASIRIQGILQPLVVRKKGDGYELIAGERRWRAAGLLKLKVVPVNVREMDDEQVLESQIHENLHREDLHPLDEAVGYKYLLDHVKIHDQPMTIEELSLRVGKDPHFVVERMQLCKLSEEAKKDFWNGRIALGHAVEIARLAPELQAETLAACYENKNNWGAHQPDKDKTVPVRKLREYISRHILRELKNAPFDTKSRLLRPDGLTCVECPMRSGNNQMLFPDITQKDVCTNADCFGHKTRRHVQLLQIAIAVELKEKQAEHQSVKSQDENLSDQETVSLAADGAQSDETVVDSNDQKPIAPAATIKNKPKKLVVIEQTVEDKFLNKVPLLSSEWSRDNQTPKEVLCRNEFKTIEKEKDKCELAERAVWQSGDNIGKSQWICRNKACQTHYYQSTGGDYGRTKPSRETFLKRKQELFDIRVAEPVRVEVFRQGVNSFNSEKWIFEDEFFRMMLIARLCVDIFLASDKHQAGIIREILELDETTLKCDWNWSDTVDERIFKLAKEIEKLTPDLQSKLLYLATVAAYGENVNPHRFLSQERVKRVAEHQSINYLLIDAQKQVETAESGALPKKFRPAAKEYLISVEATISNESKKNVRRPKYFEDFEKEQNGGIQNTEEITETDDGVNVS